MDPNAKKTALRMIPYGLFVLTAAKGDRVSAGTVNWVTRLGARRPTPPLTLTPVIDPPRRVAWPGVTLATRIGFVERCTHNGAALDVAEVP